MPPSVSANLTNRQKSLIVKSREINYKIRNSAFYVRPTTEVPGIIRYEYGRESSQKSNKRFLPDASYVLANCLGGRKRTAMGAFFPDELVCGQKSTRAFESVNQANNKGKRGVDLGLDVENPKEEDDADEEDEFGEEEEEEENEDYTKDYFQSDDDDGDDDDGDAEPVF